ncbi:transglycosylase family protein [Streptomyces gibsoniae]|uniref:Transglycosylase family protein n=1 Tax=Streptomyces gibsoniae TaxID=3075529 RepID=A0ABU2TYR9_9ACTN|nr:transglycosylase family protein [Streptomyces sp. DSM 41699]MDT0466074.1 transglycosylase family protein [Streptomyces sp. DSM 41699]
MLSGNGRHRRPRQAPALLVAAGVTGSAIAIPLLAATGASAASGTTWDRVAECESGGAWSADHDNGRYGGLQLTQEDWDKYGGLEFATSPDQASRSQQIAVAEKILDKRGVSAFGACGTVAGLGQDKAAADVDTGVGDHPSGGGAVFFSDTGVGFGSSDTPDESHSSKSHESSGASDSAKPSDSSGSASTSPSSSPSSSGSPSSSSSPSSSDSPSTLPSSPSSSTATDDSTGDDEDGNGSDDLLGTLSATTKGDQSDKVAQNGASSASGAGRHRGDSADEGDTDGRSGESAGRHASRDSAAGRETADDSYLVRLGDTLSSIADFLDLKGGWHALYDANKQEIGADPNHIMPGLSLVVTAGLSGDES